MNLYQKVMC